MRRLLRWTFNLAAVLSAVLFSACVMLWAANFHTQHPLSLEWNWKTCGVCPLDGRLFIWNGVRFDPHGRLFDQRLNMKLSGPIISPDMNSPAGLGETPDTAYDDADGNAWLFTIISVPFWLVLIGFMILPGVFIVRRWRAKRRRVSS